ncbi:MAG: hypothetical protein VB064_14085 [Oscillospiraceae bacterium]|nr:hypothetical protein [Oscillospiraceae bacterium]
MAILAAVLLTRTGMPARSFEADSLRSSLAGITGIGRGAFATAGGVSRNGWGSGAEAESEGALSEGVPSPLARRGSPVKTRRVPNAV